MYEFILEFLKELHNKGVSWGAILTALLLWNKMQRNKGFKERDERVERNQRRIMEHLGVEGGEWATPQRTLMQMVLMNLNKSLYSSQMDIRQGNQLRRVKRMIKALLSSFSKKLAALIIAAAVTALNNKFGFELNTDAIYGLYAVTIAYIAGQSHVDAKKAISKAANSIAAAVTESAATTDGSPIQTITAMPMSYNEMLPYLQDINKDLTEVYDALKSGRYNDQTQHALNIAMTVHEYLKSQNKGA